MEGPAARRASRSGGMKKTLLVTGALIAVGISAGAYYMRRGDKPPQVMTAQVTRGDIVDAVGATGTLEAVTTVQVGTQVSGTVQELYADFNSIVRKGQVIARLDPSLTQTQIEQQQANVARAQAEVERLRVALDDAKVKLQRAARSLEPQPDPPDGAGNRGGERPDGGSAAQVGAGRPHAGAREPEPDESQSGLHGHPCADRRHRDLAQRGRGSDRGGQHAGADAVPPRRGPHQDEGEREHRRGGRGAHPSRADGPFPRRCLPYRRVPRHRLADSAAAGGRAERRDLRDGDRRAEPGPEAQAGDDRERFDRNRPQARRRSRSGNGASVPAYLRYVRRARTGSAAGDAASARQRSGERGESESGGVVTACDRHPGWQRRRCTAATTGDCDRRAVLSPSINSSARCRRPRRPVACGNTSTTSSSRHACDWESPTARGPSCLAASFDRGPSS